MSESGWSLGRLTISGVVESGVAELRLAGELDLASVEELERHLLSVEQERPKRLIVDLGELSFIDSTGLRTLLQADARASERDCELVLRPGDASVQRVFDVTGALEVLNFEPRPSGSPDPEGPAHS